MPTIKIVDAATPQRPEFYEIETGTDVYQWIADNTDLGELDASVSLNGKVIIKSRFDEALASKLIAIDNDIITVVKRQGEPMTILIAAVSISVAVSLLLTPKFDPGNADATGTSPNSQLNAASNTFRPDEAVPDNYGFGRWCPDFVQPSYYYYEDNLKVFEELFCIGEGEYHDPNVFIGESPLEQQNNSTFEIYPPGVLPPENIRITARSTASARGQGAFVLVEPNSESIGIPMGDIKSMIETNGQTAITLYDSSVYIETSLINDTDFLTGQVQAEAGGSYSQVLESGTYQVLSVVDDALGKVITIAATLVFDVQEGRNIKGQLLKTNSAGSVNDAWTSWIVIPGDKNEGAYINLKMPQGCRNENGGEIQVDYEAQIREVDESGEPIAGGYTESISGFFKAATANGLFRTERFGQSTGGVLPAGRYSYRIRRTTDKFPNGADRVEVEEAVGIEPQPNPLYAPATHISVQRRADPLVSDTGQSKIFVEATRMLGLYRDGSYSSTLQPARSFADAVYHMLVIKSGKQESKIDLDSLFGIYNSLSSPELGYFDFSFQDAKVSLNERIAVACNVARVLAYQSYGGEYSFIREEKRPFVQGIYNRNNIAEFPEVSNTFFLPDAKDGVEVEYVDPVNNVRAVEYRAIVNGQIVSGTSSNPNKVKLSGCRSQAQAANRADLEVRKLLYQNKSAEMKILYEGALIQKGYMIAFADPFDGDFFQGEILSVSGNTFKTSERFTPQSGVKYFVQCNGLDGSISPLVECLPVAGDEFAFQAVGLSGAFVADRFNGIGQKQLGSKYLISNDADVSKTRWTVLDVKPDNNKENTATLSLAAYREIIFEKD